MKKLILATSAFVADADEPVRAATPQPTEQEQCNSDIATLQADVNAFNAGLRAFEETVRNAMDATGADSLLRARMIRFAALVENDPRFLSFGND